MTARPPFYLVWREGGREPTYKHTTAARAKAEADRIARIAPGSSVYVLAPIAVTKCVDVERQSFDLSHLVDDDDVPF